MKKIIRMATVCALAGVALLTACTKDYAVDIAKVQSDVDAAKAEITTLKTNIDNLSKSVTTINSEIATIKTNLETKASKADLEAANKKIAALETTAKDLQSQITAAVAKFANYYTKDEVKTEIAKLYTNAQIEKMVADAQAACKTYTDAAAASCNTYADAAAQKTYDAVLNILKGYATKDDLDTALAASKKYSDEKVAELAGQLAKDLDDLKKEVKDYTDEAILSAMDTVAEAIATLTGRVQSLSFVPEFTTKSGIVAKARKFYRGEVELIENNVTVAATFSVFPANKTSEVLEALKAGKANLVYVNTTSPVATKAAGVVETAVLACAEINDLTGNIDLIANLTKFEGKGAIALQYDVENDAQLSSEFVTVFVETVDVAELYGLYNAKKEAYANQTVENPWDVVPAQVNWYEGYEILIKDGEDFYTPSEYATLLGLEANALDLLYKVVYTDNKETKALEFPVDAKTATAPVVLDFAADYTRMVADIEKTKANVGENATSAGTFYYTVDKTDVPVLEYANSYTIGKRTINVELEGIANPIPWTYNLAVALSSAKATANYLDEALCYDTNKPFTQNFLPIAFQFKEQKVVKPESFTKDQEKSIYDLINSTPEPATKAVLNGKEVAGVKMLVDDVAIIKSHIASVSVKGYKFDQKTDNSYVLTNAYENATDKLNIVFSMVLGKCAPDATVALSEGVIDFPAVSSVEVAESFNTVFNAGQAPFFADYAQFQEALANCVATKTTLKDKTPVTNTYATIGAAKSTYTLSAGDVTTFADKFTTTNTFTTWFGNKYVVNGSISLKAPVQVLDFWTDRVDVTPAAVAAVVADENLIAARKDVTGVSTLEGRFTQASFPYPQRYYVNNDDLSKYFKAVNVPADTKSAYTVSYALVNTNVAPAYANLPAISTPKVDVVDVEKCELSASPIDWRDYANRTLIVKATLNYDNNGTAMKIAEKTLFLQTAKPVTVAAGSVEKPFATNSTINFYVPSVLSVKGIVDPEQELVDQTSTNLFWALLPAAAQYGVEFTLPDDVNISFNGENYTTKTFPGQKFSWDKTTGTLSYKTDAAVITDDITITAKFTAKYYYMYWGNTADQSEFVATFVVKK